jgi:hypothetical protein
MFKPYANRTAHIRHYEHQQVSHNAQRFGSNGCPRSADQAHPKRCLTRYALGSYRLGISGGAHGDGADGGAVGVVNGG